MPKSAMTRSLALQDLRPLRSRPPLAGFARLFRMAGLPHPSTITLTVVLQDRLPNEDIPRTYAMAFGKTGIESEFHRLDLLRIPFFLNSNIR
jgi:hypothetical protein